MTKVSVIIPIYNTAPYLPRCLDSLLAQTLDDIELICIDDCSTDNSLSVLTHYSQKDPRIKLIINKKHKGVSFSRNEAIKTADGEYIGFVDSDDYVDFDFYEKLYLAAHYDNADIAKGDLREVFPDGKVRTYPVNESILKYHNKLCFNLSFTTGIYRKALLLKHNHFFNIKLIHTEDLVWLNKAVISANKVAVITDVFYYYIRRGDSTDTEILSDEKIFSALIGYKHIFIKTCQYARLSSLDFSFCYQFLINATLNLIFRTPSLENKRRCCKLLLFFYYTCSDDISLSGFIKQAFPYFFSFFEQNDLNAFTNYVIGKQSLKQIIFENLRYGVKQKSMEKHK